MKKNMVILLILTLSLTMFAGCKKENSAEGETTVEVAENVVAVVNDEFITIEEFNKYYAMQSYDFEKEYGENVWTIEQKGRTMREIRQEQTLDYLIRISLIKGYVTDNGFEVEDSVIDEAYEKYMASKEGDEDINEYFLENELDEVFLKGFLKDQLYLRVYKEQIFDGIINNPETVEMLFKDKYIRYKTSHILVDLKDKELLEEVRARILDEEEPADFSEMAREHSIHSTSAVRGGDLGYVTVGNMPEAYEEVALTLELYTVSELVETEYGYHIIFAEDRQMLSDMEVNMPEEELNVYKDEIISKYANLEVVRVFEKLKDEATIEIFQELIDQEK